MKRKLTLLIFTFFLAFYFSTYLHAQATLKNEYYIEIKDVNNKTTAKAIELLIKSNSNVIFFSGYKLPVSFYLLKTSKEISKAEFETWLHPLGVELVVFEQKDFSAKHIQSKKTGGKITGKKDVVDSRN